MGKFKPSYKSEQVDGLITKIFGDNRKEVINNDQCVTCLEPNLEFRNELSEGEYTISGMCQNCQDDFFGED